MQIRDLIKKLAYIFLTAVVLISIGVAINLLKLSFINTYLFAIFFGVSAFILIDYSPYRLKLIMSFFVTLIVVGIIRFIPNTLLPIEYDSTYGLSAIFGCALIITAVILLNTRLFKNKAHTKK